MSQRFDNLPFSAVLQSVADLILGLKQDVPELRGTGPADGKLVLEVSNTTHLHVGGRVCSHCKDTHKCYRQTSILLTFVRERNFK